MHLAGLAEIAAARSDGRWDAAYAPASTATVPPRSPGSAGVTYADAAGEEHRVAASVVVLAAYSVQTPRLLLASATDRFPAGLANRSFMVGRSMMAHVSGDALGNVRRGAAPVHADRGQAHRRRHPARRGSARPRQAHDHENLFLAGAGLFPISGAVNPTFTLSALALRSADHIIRNWSSLA